MKRAAQLSLGMLIGALSSPHMAFAWDNPAERYVDAYLQYVDSSCPIAADNIHHFVYFATDRDAMRDHPFLESDRFEGAQIMYAWRNLEPSEGVYDFSELKADADYLAAHGKKLFIQLQDATFSPQRDAVPQYLKSEAYAGGQAKQYGDSGQHEGWVAKRWNPEIRSRFAKLLAALGKEFDGQVEGINLQESVIGVSNDNEPDFDPGSYVEALKSDMTALKAAFPQSTTMQYANFMPGEWLPWEDEGYLSEIYRYGEEIGVGLGAPDLMFKRKGQLNHPIAMMHENEYTAPLGIAVQDGNYVGATNDESVVEGRTNIVPVLHAFAKDFLKVDYMFWVDQKPYFSEDVMPCFAGN